MSATDQVRNLLDELMGATRDGGERRLEFDDPRVCRSFLLDCCPHEIFSRTRLDLGRCPRSHQPGLKSDYKRECTKRPYYYEIDALQHLETFVSECDRRTATAKEKLRETQEELSDEAAEKVEAINKLSEEIGTTLAKAELKGADGLVDDSLKLMQEVDELNEQKAKLETELRNAIPLSTYQQQKLRVCDACSSYLGDHDNDKRLADHFGGKLHLGFITVREKLAALRLYVEENDLVRKRNQANEGRRETPFIPSQSNYGNIRDRARNRNHFRRSRSRSRSPDKRHISHRPISRHFVDGDKNRSSNTKRSQD